MPLPSFDELRLPILKLLASGETLRKAQLIEPLAAHFGLDADDVSQEYESGNGAIFADRISWALSYLALSGLLSRPKRGYYAVTDLGREYAQKDAAEVIAYVKQKMAERVRAHKDEDKEKEAVAAAAEIEGITPTEQLESSFEAIRQEIYDEILSTILSKTPQAFEKLVVDLLQKMGYGGRLEKSAQVTRQSRDGGIDGEIREDVLGLGRIFIQAKRYQRDAVIGRPDIQGFVGALQGQNADKGIFITTARYSPDAVRYVQNLSATRVVLIDGRQLAEYIYRYDVGMQTEQVFTVKKLDGDFWDEMPDDTAKPAS